MQPVRSGWMGRWIVLCSAAACCTLAWGQYVWIDEKGVKQYSDKPPPPSIPTSKIIKPARSVTLQAASTPSPTPSAAAADAPAPTAGTVPQSSTKAAPTIAERNAEFNKRRAEQAVKDRKAGDQQKLAQEKAANCERAASYKRSLESGTRMSRIDKNGEQTFISDEQRAKELAETTKRLAECA